ncbi:unnamed protein product [Bursaphelenchus okinawaensis]|uniref:M-phase phosphoprotein 6 n=1 Tax=Bursaphelenchus okinawaensis TaxID=465554 RepID=A0A811JWF4_9BILA|nr:unnamed protein product [Bursaphelenchus okinawaensis]CAG9085449.1 unnamed protein product [Bursaphelenchus okinawaensis]
MDDEAAFSDSKPVKAYKISASVLQMNFMKKTYNQVEMAKKRRNRINKPNKTKVFPTLLRYDDDPVEGLHGMTVDDRFTRIEKFRFGRFSFGGQNPEVEDLMQLHNNKKRYEDGEISDEEISAKEMAETFQSYRKRPLDIKEEPRENEDIIIETGIPTKKRKNKVKMQGNKDF